MAPVETWTRGFRGRFAKKSAKSRTKKKSSRVMVDHNYVGGHVCSLGQCDNPECSSNFDLKWRHGRRIIELGVLLENLKFCCVCKLGPVPLTVYNVTGELQRGLGGYLYVKCQNPECGAINRAAYGKTHRRTDKRGTHCFDVNTKLGAAMIDGIGGPDRVNNMLAGLNIKPINPKNLKRMERRAGHAVEIIAERSMEKAAKDAFSKEMLEIADSEIKEAEDKLKMNWGMGILVDNDLERPVAQMIDTTLERWDEQLSPEIHVPKKLQQIGTFVSQSTPDPAKSFCNSSLSTPLHLVQHIQRTPDAPLPQRSAICKRSCKAAPVKLLNRYPCKTRHGMSCAVDTAWHKRGFDSLTSHTFFMSKAKYGKKVLKTVVSHRTCGTCKWWRRNRPKLSVRPHRCVHNHCGSAKLMESTSGLKGIEELNTSGTPVEYIEGDGDNTLIARLKSDLNINMKKRFDRNHIVKNVGKQLYSLAAEKGVKLAKTVITHIQKCLKYTFAKNQGDKEGMKNNLRALIPHQFGDHSMCEARFCGFKRIPGCKDYKHRSLPYKSHLKDTHLKSRLEKVFEPVIANSWQYIDLGSSQQCEHANREVTLRAPKSLHYGNSESLDFRVQASAAFINEGRSYLTLVNDEAGLSPGKYTSEYALKQMTKRRYAQERMALPAIKRRRLVLKQERAINVGAQEALEGTSYESGVGHSVEADIQKIPEPVAKGDFSAVRLPSEIQPTLIMFDLETTDLIRGKQYPHITQIAAVDIHDKRAFNNYVVPRLPITNTAQQITGIALSSSSSMTHHGEPVTCYTIADALKNLIQWIKKFSYPVLVAHNGRRFDFPVLTQALYRVHMINEFSSVVSGLIDSLNIFKKAFPGLSSYKQEHLAETKLQESYAAHDADADVKMLGKLVRSTDMTTGAIMKHSFHPLAPYQSLLYANEKCKNRKSLECLIAQGVMKMTTAENIAGSGLNLSHLKLIFSRGGENALRDIFMAKNLQGQPRVTAVKRTLDDVIPKLCEYLGK